MPFASVFITGFYVTCSGDVHLQLPSSVRVDGRKLTFMNDLDVDQNGNIYFTDSSSLYQRRDFARALLDNRGNGR